MKKLAFHIIFICSFLVLTAQGKPLQFKHLDNNSGLSSNQITCLFKNSQGYIWIGTVNGLNRFDGYEIKVFRKIKNDSTSLLDNNISSIHEDYLGKLWIVTNSGLTIFDPVTEKFSTDHPVFHKNIELPRTDYVDIFTDANNNFWLIHRENGIYKYNPATDSIEHAACSSELLPYNIDDISIDANGFFWIIDRKPAIELFDPKRFKVIQRYTTSLDKIPYSANVYNMLVDADNHAWIFMVNDEKGIFYFDPDQLSLIHYTSKSSKYHISHDNISCLATTQDGNMLIGSDHGGLNVIDKNTGKTAVYENEVGDKNSLSQNSITSLLCDDNGIIWIGTYKKGINYYHPDLFKFMTYTINPTREDWLSNEDVNTFAEDKNGNLWIGSNGGGLIYFDRKKNVFKTYKHESTNSNSLSSNVIVDLCMDHKGGLWIGTYIGGLNYFDGKKFIHYMYDPANPRSLPNNNVWSVFEDSEDRLWIGTLGGISAYDRGTKDFTRFEIPNETVPNAIMSISENINGNIWFATANGVDLFDNRSGRFIEFFNDENSSNTLSTNSTLDIYCDSRGWVWIATREGLNVYDPKTQQFKVFDEENGILDNTILTILEANDGNMWLATPQGLTNLILSNNKDSLFSFTTKNYDERDGLHGKEFNEHAALKTSKGELIFGGSDGFSIFNPENLSTTLLNPKVFFDDLKVQNKIVEPGRIYNKRVLLPKTLNFVENIAFKHFEKTFSVSFSAINYLNPEKTIFHYKLDGFNDDWITTGANKREATYTNLHPDDYTFKVYASDLENELKSNEIRLNITVLPPFWKTKWAYSLYLIVVLFTVFYAMQLTIKRERNKFLIEQERRETNRIHEMDMLKLKFFTNISHELRTPLTLIIAPLEHIMKSTKDENSKSQLQLVQRNARRLLNLVNQLLDFRKLEVQGLTLEVSKDELVAFCRDTVESFSDLAESHNIKLIFNSNIKELKASFDYDKIEKIIFNLLSNAFKYTPGNGSINVNLTVEDNAVPRQVKLEVCDTGVGIPKEKQELIFERFVQNIPNGSTVKGSGIGLSLTREFVQMHEGTIDVESKPGAGSRFTVILPLKEQFELQSRREMISDKVSLEKRRESKHDTKPGKKAAFKILLVEDNPDIRFYLKDNLKTDYEVFEAPDGAIAWKQIPRLMPDLIVSDIMMPEMDGIELCKKVKNDSRTSHIPVILLTARTTDQQKYEGLKTGADEYITKPFSFEMLELRIEQLIKQRQKLIKLFQKNIDIRPSEINITSLDEKFLAKVKDITEKNMQEPNFSVEKLSAEVGISRAHLYNKLNALTGKTPIEYIRIMRIRRAAQLLEKSQLTVMEVAYKVGFNDPRYFTKHFKSEYKMTPSQYIKKHSLHSSPSGQQHHLKGA